MSGEADFEALLEIICTSARQAIAEYKKGGHDVPRIHSKTFHPIDFAFDAVSLKKAVRVLEGACQQLCASLAPPQRTLVQLNNPCGWTCIRIITRAKVADALEKYPDGLHISELSKLVNLDKGKLARVLRFLATQGCFTEVEPNTFANNRISLVTASSCDVSHIDKEYIYKSAAVLYEAMTDPDFAASDSPGKAPLFYALRKEGYEGTLFDLFTQDDEKRKSFHRAMIGANQTTGSLSVLHHYPWKEAKAVCDVGASIGAISIPLSRMYPHLKIINQDLPEVIVQAKDVWSKDAPELLQNNQVEFVPLNFFTGSPVPSQDVYYLRQIIHDWQDAEATNILRNIKKVMAPHSRLLIHEAILIPNCADLNATESFGLAVAPKPLLPNFGNGSHLPYKQDLMMWMMHNSKERTLAELIALGAAAELRLEKVYDLVDTVVLDFRVAT